MEHNSIIFDLHICGACRKEFNDFNEFIKHKEECVVLTELIKQRTLSGKLTQTSIQHTLAAESNNENQTRCLQPERTENVFSKSSVESFAYYQNQLSSSVISAFNTSLASVNNFQLPQVPVQSGPSVLPANFVATSRNSNIEIPRHNAGESILQSQFAQKPPHSDNTLPGDYLAKLQQETVSSGNQVTTPVGHEYARQAVEGEENKGRADETNNSQPMCQIVTTDNERYVVITNTGQGDICIPITADNTEVLTMLQNYINDSNDPGTVFLTSPQKDTCGTRERHSTNQEELSSSHATMQSSMPHLSQDITVGSTNCRTLSSVLGQPLPKPVIKPHHELGAINTEKIQNSSQPTLQMQLDHNVSFSLLSPSLVNSSILSDPSHNPDNSQQHLLQESVQIPAVRHSNQPLLNEATSVTIPTSMTVPTAVTIPTSEISLNTVSLTTNALTQLSEISLNTVSLATKALTPLSVNTDPHNVQRLSDIQLTPNTVLTSLDNLSKYSNIGSLEGIGIHNLGNVSKDADGQGNELLTEGSVQNLEMSSVVYMGDNSFSVHFQTPGKPAQGNLSTETLHLDSQQMGLSQIVEGGVTTNGQIMDGGVNMGNPIMEGRFSMENQMESGVSMRKQMESGVSTGNQMAEGSINSQNQMVDAGVRMGNQVMNGGASIENPVMESGISQINEDEIQESQVVEELHQAYLRTQQNKEKQLSQQQISKKKQTARSHVNKQTERSPGNKQKNSCSKEKKYKCNIPECSFMSAYMKDLERHMRVHTGERPYSCEYCNKSFSRLDKLRLHIKGHTGEKPFKCELCDYRAVDNGSIKKHMVVHSDNKRFKCQTCPYTCRTSSQLVVHLRKHTGDAPFSCLYCDSKFKIKSDMKRHMRTHTGEKPFKCEKCEFSCSAKSNLVSHYNVHHSTTQKVCEHCDFSTSSKKSFFEHQKIHSTPDPENICKVCQYVCSSKQTLKSHIANSHNYKLYVCKDCHFSSKSLTKARYHYNNCRLRKKSNTHQKKSKKRRTSSRDDDSQGRKYDKNYVCEICSEGFVRKDSLNSHLKLHRERTQSTLSTALTVLELQQPVINSTAVPHGGDHNYDMEVVNISSSFGNRRDDHNYEKEEGSISSSFRNRRGESSSENEKNSGRIPRKSHRINSQRRQKSSKPSSSGTTSLKNFEKCKPRTNTALCTSRILEQSKFGQLENLISASQSQEIPNHCLPRASENLSTVAVSVNQAGEQSNSATQNQQGELATTVISSCDSQVQNPNIQVVQNITVPVIQLDNGQLVAMQQVGNAEDQIFSLVAVNQLIGSPESTVQSGGSSDVPADGLVQIFSPNCNSYVSILPQSLIQQNPKQSTNSVSQAPENQGLALPDNSVQSVFESSHSQQPSLHQTKVPLESSMMTALHTSTTTSVTESSTSFTNSKYKHKDSLRSQHSCEQEDSSSQIDVESIELDDTSYDFNLQDSDLVSKETIKGGQPDL